MTTATSSDGRVTATTDDPYAGVILQAFFGDTNLASNPVAVTATTYWALSGSAPTGSPVLSRVTSGGPPPVATFIRSTWAGTSGSVTGGVLYSSPSDPTMLAAPGQLISTSVQVRCSKIQRVQLSLVYLNSGGTALATTTSAATVLAANTWTQLKIDQATVAPAGTTKVWLFVFSVPGTSGTVWQSGDTLDMTALSVVAGATARAYLSQAGGQPEQVTFERDGARVRSGDPAWAAGGDAIAYDHEAPLGAAAAWRAQPIYADGTVGEWTTGATLTAPAMATDVDCWIKPLDNPSLSVALEVHTDRVEVASEPRVTLSQVQGRTHPAASWDKRTPAAIGVTLRTDTKAEKDALAAALDAGPVLVQLRTSYGIDDFYAIPMGASQRYFIGMHSALRDNPTAFQPIARPPTIDSPLRVPGRSYAETLELAATYAASTLLWPTYADILGL